MLLSDRDICAKCESGIPLVSPLYPEQLQAASYDVRLSNRFYVEGEARDVRGMFLLGPREMILGATQEVICLPNDLAGRVEGKSGWARIGLQVENAGHIDPGYHGVLTLELVNLSRRSVKLSPGVLIAKVEFIVLSSPCKVPYSSNRNSHQDSEGPGL